MHPARKRVHVPSRLQRCCMPMCTGTHKYPVALLAGIPHVYWSQHCLHISAHAICVVLLLCNGQASLLTSADKYLCTSLYEQLHRQCSCGSGRSRRCGCCCHKHTRCHPGGLWGIIGNAGAVKHSVLRITAGSFKSNCAMRQGYLKLLDVGSECKCLSQEPGHPVVALGCLLATIAVACSLLDPRIRTQTANLARWNLHSRPLTQDLEERTVMKGT